MSRDVGRALWKHDEARSIFTWEPGLRLMKALTLAQGSKGLRGTWQNYSLLFLIHSHPSYQPLIERASASGYPNYGVAEKGCPVLSMRTSLLRPWKLQPTLYT